MTIEIVFKLNEQVGQLSLDEVRKQLSNNGFAHWENASDNMHFRRFAKIEVWAQPDIIAKYYVMTEQKVNIDRVAFKLVGSNTNDEGDEKGTVIIAVLGYGADDIDGS